MKILLFSDKIPFEKDYLSTQYQYLINNLLENNTIYIALPFSDQQLILSDYENLKKNGIELPDIYHKCLFLLYHKDITLGNLNGFFLNHHIDFFLSLYHFPNLKIEDSSPMFMTKSAIWLQPNDYKLDNVTLSKWALFHHIIVESEVLYKKIVNLFPRHLVSIYHPISYPKDIKYIKERDNQDKTKIVVNLNMQNSYLLDTLLNVCSDYLDNKKYEIFIFSDNGYLKNKVNFTLPDEFLEKSIISLNSGFEDEVFQFQTGDNHKANGKYFTYHFTNLIDYFVKKKGFNDKNIQTAKISITREEIISRIANCDKYIDLSLGNNYYDKLLIANSYNKDIVTIDYLANKELIDRGSIIIPKKIDITEGELTLIDERPLQKHMFGTETKDIPKIITPKINSIINTNRFGIDFNTNLQYRESIDILRSHKIQHLYILGEIDYNLILYWLSENPILKEIVLIVKEKGYNRQDTEEFISKKEWLEKMFHQSITVQVLFEENNLKNLLTVQNNMFIIHSSTFSEEIKELEKEQILKNFYQNVQDLNFYTLIIQDKPKLLDYRQKTVTNKVFITDKKNIKYEINNIENFGYEIDFFYSLTENDMKEMNNWYQEMVTSGYLDIKSNVRNINEFLKFFRHYVLWEELAGQINENKIYEIQYIGEEEEIESSLDSLTIPDVDITFVEKPLNLNHYIITKKGLDKLLKYTKPIKYLFTEQIKFSIIRNGILGHTLVESSEKESLDLNIIDISVKKELMKKSTITYTQYFTSFFGNIFNYFFGSWISRIQSYILSKGVNIMLYLAKKEMKK